MNMTIVFSGRLHTDEYLTFDCSTYSYLSHDDVCLSAWFSVQRYCLLQCDARTCNVVQWPSWPQQL